MFEFSIFVFSIDFNRCWFCYFHHEFPTISHEQCVWQHRAPCCISSKFYCVFRIRLYVLLYTSSWQWRVRNEQNMLHDFYGLNGFFYRKNVALFLTSSIFSICFSIFLWYKKARKKAEALLLEQNQTSKSNESVDGWLLSKCTSQPMRTQKAFSAEYFYSIYEFYGRLQTKKYQKHNKIC